MQTEQDPQLTYVINEARGIINLDAAIRETLARGEKLSTNAEAYALSNASVEDLLKMEKTEGVYRAILTRENVPVETLQTALTGLAKLRNVAEIEELFTLIEELNAKASVNVLNSLSQLLASQPADQLAKVRDRIATLATTAKSGETRRVAIAAWISADNNGDAVFAAVEKEQLKLEDALRAVSLGVIGGSEEFSVRSTGETCPDVGRLERLYTAHSAWIASRLLCSKSQQRGS
jgi:hypothetical protein